MHRLVHQLKAACRQPRVRHRSLTRQHVHGGGRANCCSAVTLATSSADPTRFATRPYSVSHLSSLPSQNYNNHAAAAAAAASAAATTTSLSRRRQQRRRLLHVDAHCHLTSACFGGGLADQVAEAAAAAGVSRICVNGTDPRSNDAVLALCARHPNLVPACGVHPLHAAAELYGDDATWRAATAGAQADADDGDEEDTKRPAPFDAMAEVARIRDLARDRRIAAIGECGLDEFYYKRVDWLARQQQVLEALCAVAVEFDLPVILHSRHCEARVFDLVRACGVQRAIFHCFSGEW
jgi:Tat protein secretion system quality control protein TatD with DNase activity